MECNPPAKIAFEFKGSGAEYFQIWIVNVFLSVITLGIYSAWAKVRRKQYFYGNTSITGTAFRYLAAPTKILKGRLIVFAGFVVYSIAGKMFPFLGIVLLIAVFIATPWLVVRSLAFNARNSAWRNIRFNFTGTYIGAARVFVLWPLLVPLTLGILAPYVYYRQKKFIVEHSGYGTTPFRFHATAGNYYSVVARSVLTFFTIAAITGGFVFLLFAFLPAFLPGSAAIFPLLFVIFLIPPYLYTFAYFSVRAGNLLYNAGTLSEHRFQATMKVKTYALIVLSNTVATVLTLGLFHPFAQVRAYRYKIQNLSLLMGGGLEQFMAAQLKEPSALGDELSDFMDLDFGI